MECPFLREARVKSCQASAYRKMIVDAAATSCDERCSSPDYVRCPAAAARLSGPAGTTHCPFLREALAEYCGAAPVTRYIPATPALLSRCKTDSHLYCDLFRVMSGECPPAATAEGHELGAGTMEMATVPAHLSLSPNHMWLDVAADGQCHVGIDAFVAALLGTVDKVSFINGRVSARPVAVLSMGGVDLQMVFPNPMSVTAANVYLRTEPSRLTADPYGAGWLFEGNADALPGGRQALGAGLLPGERAAAWLSEESGRLDAFVHERLARPQADGTRCIADGGRVIAPLAPHLDHDALIDLFNEFFAPQRGWGRSW